MGFRRVLGGIRGLGFRTTGKTKGFELSLRSRAVDGGGVGLGFGV